MGTGSLVLGVVKLLSSYSASARVRGMLCSCEPLDRLPFKPWHGIYWGALVFLGWPGQVWGFPGKLGLALGRSGEVWGRDVTDRPS
jgi:hypothetical protein